MQRQRKRTAIITLTNSGAQLGAKLHSLLEDSDLFIPSHRALDIADAHRFDDGVGNAVRRAFKEYDRLVLVFSLGIAVRALAKCLESKKRDPAVVVVDEKGQFAISLLSGHVGGANYLARNLAQMIGATPVITTASDINNTIAVDLLGQEFDWEIEDWTNVVRASAAIVNGEAVGIFQDAGELHWLGERPLPNNISVVGKTEDLQTQDFAAGLIITDRLLGQDLSGILAKSVVYRPKSLVVGIGCNRGTTAQEIETNVRRVLATNGFSFRSIRSVATIDVKESEVGLLEFAKELGIPIRFFSSEALDAVNGIANPSEMVRRAIGCPSVCEAAAILEAGADMLVVEKTKAGNVTVAVARIPFGG